MCGKRIPIRLKGTFYKAVVRPAMMYGTECWAVDRNIEQRMGVAEMIMLRWISVSDTYNNVGHTDTSVVVVTKP